uniref:Uncharacterized protein n=1 Tax=Ciona intestinalis TaxID=7719 RepID=F6ZV94_CIOIN
MLLLVLMILQKKLLKISKNNLIYKGLLQMVKRSFQLKTLRMWLQKTRFPLTTMAMLMNHSNWCLPKIQRDQHQTHLR